jgi:hypothetical protein
MKHRVIFALAVMAAIGSAPAGAQPAPNSIDAHLAAAKKAGGFEFRGLLGALCVAPRNTATRDATPAPPPPDRARWYTEPAKVFDETIEQSVKSFPNGKPKRDISVTDRQDITLGGRTVTVVPMPGHTPGTLSLIFQVKDNGTPLTVAFPGGTEFNFVNDVPHFDTYIPSARKFAAAAAAAAAGATVLMTNQSEFDNAASKIRMLASRRPGEPHPLEVGRDLVQGYFKVFDECAQVARMKLL